MTIKRRVAALEARHSAARLSLGLRAWLGHPLTDDEQVLVRRESERPTAIDWTKISKEDREWLQA